MIRNLKYAIIADIGKFNPVFYDHDKKEELAEMCKLHGITYLPSITRKSAYKLVNNQFEEAKIENHLKVNPYDRLFDQQTIDKFQNGNSNEIRFIMEHDEIRGVVHIVDYNNDFIDVELFKSLLQFETNLRQLLIAKGLNNQSFISWIKDKPESSDPGHHWYRRLSKIEYLKDEMDNANTFQTFYLRELLEFADSKKLVDLYQSEIEDVNNLRNLLAHNKDAISHTSKNGSIIYNKEGLQDFANQMRAFFYAYDILAKSLEKEKPTTNPL